MTRKPGPTIRRWQLGQELRELREAAGIPPKVAAEELEIGPSTLSKIEGGKQTIKGTYVKLLAPLYGVDAERRDHLLTLATEANQPEWYSSFSKWVPDWFRLYLGYESSASAIRTYESELVPGLLQTERYAKAVAGANRPNVTEADLARTLELRRGRQTQMRQPDSIVFHAVINEAVIRRSVGGDEVMREQVEQLTEIARQPHVTLQVLPFDVGAHPAMTAPFTLLGFEDCPGMNTVYLESGRGALYLEKQVDLDRYGWMFDRLSRMAFSPADSRDFLGTVSW